MTTDTKLAPTDDEIDAIVYEQTGFDGDGTQPMTADEMRRVTRAVLARWGQPAPRGAPVAWLSPWRADQVTTDYDAYGKHGIPLYTAPQPVEREPLTHAQAKALVLKYGNDPLHLVYQVEVAHGITKGGQHGTE